MTENIKHNASIIENIFKIKTAINDWYTLTEHIVIVYFAVIYRYTLIKQSFYIVSTISGDLFIKICIQIVRHNSSSWAWYWA